MNGTTGSVIAATAVCHACEELLGRVEGEWPGGDADRALERLRARVDGLLVRASAAASRACAQGPTLEVRCLGPTRLTAGGAAIAPPRRSRLVFQYLVARRRRPVPRDVLLEAFWPGSSPRAARNSLNVAVTLLRRAFRPVYGDCPIVVFRDEAYALEPGLDVWVDREEFGRLAREGDRLRRAGDLAEAVSAYRRADALYGGPLFEEEPYEDWIVTARREVEGEHLDVLGHLGDCLASLGEHETSAEAYRRILAAEPHRDDVRRLLAERYEALGRPGLAQRLAHVRKPRNPQVIAA
ncbi:MAG TPA: BTAD domain-containing putative transcriptional regulator [Miltoncostaeaceae bacterium]|jgi:DNA-binding SARP family transcriptional activator|nr:BTAD domain-containing putative transcriptional regulator [Miltoncostaeaceae bacterium]